MADARPIADPAALLAAEDHMRAMERIALDVLRIERPSPSLARVTGRIEAQDPAAWTVPNLAVRLEFETQAEGRPVTRVYTIRAFDPARSEVEIDFVLHPDESPAMRWLAAARPGTRIMMTGPREHARPAFRPGRTAALFADDTAVPAVHAILSAWPEGAPGAVWIDAEDPAPFEALPRPAGVAFTLLRRAPGIAPGAARALAACAVQTMDPARWTIWAAGERDEIGEIRAAARAAGFAKEDLRVLGYWRRGVSGEDLDRARLDAYAALRAQGGRLEDVDDAVAY